MKKLSILAIVMLASDAHAQTKSGPLRVRSSKELTQDSSEAAARLDAARKSGDVEQGRIGESTAADGTMAGKARTRGHRPAPRA